MKCIPDKKNPHLFFLICSIFMYGALVAPAEFSSQNPNQVAHNHLITPVPGDPTPSSDFKGQFDYTCTYILYIMKIEKKLYLVEKG